MNNLKSKLNPIIKRIKILKNWIQFLKIQLSRRNFKNYQINNLKIINQKK